mmetsp:Transcript_8920/g.18237  ORF Transcript_8920/g.18237 Transcript_8920/m.18237 type:complete len:117 (-) Transcript_8920:107-457(-)
MVDDLFYVLGEYFRPKEEEGNPVMDLIMLGFSKYMGALDELLHDDFLGVKQDSVAGLFDRSDPEKSPGFERDAGIFDRAFGAFVDRLEERWDKISAHREGGHLGQLQRWRESLNLP